MASKHSVLSIALLLSLLVSVASGSGARFNHQISKTDVGCVSYVGVLECKGTQDCEGPCFEANLGSPLRCITNPPGLKDMVCCCNGSR